MTWEGGAQNRSITCDGVHVRDQMCDVRCHTFRRVQTGWGARAVTRPHLDGISPPPPPLFGCTYA